jgi:hypothetical protein
MGTTEPRQIDDQRQAGSDDLDQWIADMNSGTTKDYLQKNVAKHIRTSPKLRDTLLMRIERLYIHNIEDTPKNRQMLKQIVRNLYYLPMLRAKAEFWDSCSKSHQVGVADSRNSNPIDFPVDKIVDDIIRNAGR